LLEGRAATRLTPWSHVARYIGRGGVECHGMRYWADHCWRRIFRNVAAC
jgi:hypothetical protein